MTFSRAVSDTQIQHPVVVLMRILYIHVMYGTVCATYVQRMYNCRVPSYTLKLCFYYNHSKTRTYGLVPPHYTEHV